MEASSSFDLFLSYNTRDREPVLRVQEALRERGIATFLDGQHLTVGLNWRDEIEVALTKVNSVAVLIGSEGFGRVQRGEKNLALDRQEFAAKAGNKFPVIPILLPGAKPDDVTGFLSQNTWIDLRAGLENAAAMDAIARAIKGQAPVPQVSPPEPLCPYRGLLAFTEDDAPLFYGRDAFADDLLCKARSLKLIAVVGPSGTGKSSVVQAGLLPRLRRECAPNATWEALIFRPGNRPFHNLANELVALYETSLSKTDQMLAANKLGEAFANNELPLDAPIAEALKATQWANRLLFIVDQFEELFTLTEEKDRKPFVNMLLNATATAPLTIVLTLRADFYGKAISVSRELSDAIQQGIVNIGYVKREELRRAIVKPAESVGLQFEDGLVDRILDNLEDEPGNLPLLEFALTELWEKRQANRVTNQRYEDIGGVGGSLGKRAEEVFTSLSHAQQELALRAFTRLVRVAAASEEGADTRQRVNLPDFTDATQKVIQGFVKARLLVTNRNEATNEEIVEVAHESLIKNWDRLKDVLSKDREFLLWRQRLTFLLTEWQRVQKETGKERDGLLYGHQLNEAKRWSKSRHDDLNAQEIKFIRKSEETAKRPKKWMAVAGSVLLLATLAAWGWKIWDDRPAAQINKIIADSKSLVSEATRSGTLWLKNLVLTGRFEVALAAARSIEGASYRTSALSTVAAASARIGRVEAAKTAAFEALTAAKYIEHLDYRSHQLSRLARAFAQVGQMEAAKTAASEALSSAKNIVDVYSRSAQLADVAETFARVGQAEVAKTTALEAMTAAKQIEGAASRTYRLHMIAQDLAQVGEISTAKLAAQEARTAAKGIEDAATRTNALTAVDQTLAEVRRIQQDINEGTYVPPIVQEVIASTSKRETYDAKPSSYERMLHAKNLANRGETWEALDVAKGIEEIILRFDALRSIARTCVQERLMEPAKVVKDEILTLVPNLGDSSRSEAYMTIATVLAIQHDYRVAREIANRCSVSDDKLHAYAVILQEYAIDREKISPELFK